MVVNRARLLLLNRLRNVFTLTLEKCGPVVTVRQKLRAIRGLIKFMPLIPRLGIVSLRRSLLLVCVTAILLNGGPCSTCMECTGRCGLNRPIWLRNALHCDLTLLSCGMYLGMLLHESRVSMSVLVLWKGSLLKLCALACVQLTTPFTVYFPCSC